MEVQLFVAEPEGFRKVDTVHIGERFLQRFLWETSTRDGRVVRVVVPELGKTWVRVGNRLIERPEDPKLAAKAEAESLRSYRDMFLADLGEQWARAPEMSLIELILKSGAKNAKAELNREPFPLRPEGVTGALPSDDYILTIIRWYLDEEGRLRGSVNHRALGHFPKGRV